jgi:hypothetical protein
MTPDQISLQRIKSNAATLRLLHYCRSKKHVLDFFDRDISA